MLPYISKGKIEGKIKGKPEHFKVTEVPLYLPSGEGNHLYLNITKKNLTSTEVKDRISKIFKFDKKRVGLAGLKDKKAVTTQTFSVNIQNKEKIKEKIDKIQKIKNLKVNWYKRHRNKLKKGHLLGNKFEIIISDIEYKNKDIKKIKKILTQLEEGIPNYYGEQRFGKQGDNHLKGLKIIKGELNVKRRWLKRFLISSYQSHLCNLYLKKRIEKGLFYKILEGDIAKKHSTGGLFVVTDLKEQKRFDNKEISFTCPIFGKKMWEAEKKAGRLEREVKKEAKKIPL
jgi:tRNA pseudouridine13 synthase